MKRCHNSHRILCPVERSSTLLIWPAPNESRNPTVKQIASKRVCSPHSRPSFPPLIRSPHMPHMWHNVPFCILLPSFYTYPASIAFLCYGVGVTCMHSCEHQHESARARPSDQGSCHQRNTCPIQRQLPYSHPSRSSAKLSFELENS